MTSSSRKTESASRGEQGRPPQPHGAVDAVDATYLESLVGYNARRASLTIIDAFLRHMTVYELRPVDFSVLSLVAHNPGITSRQLCSTLSIQPPNLVSLVNQLQKRELVTRHAHPLDGRAMGLHLTPKGKKLVKQAERTASELESAATARLSAAERKTLTHLLKKIYQ